MSSSDDALAPTEAPQSGDTLDATSSGPHAWAGGSAPLQPGTLFGRYRFEARLGAGGMGEVWAAFDRSLHRKVAVKVLHPRFAGAAALGARMLREARALAKVSHRNVVAVFDAGEIEGRVYIAMEYLDGASLGEHLRRSALPGVVRPGWMHWLGLLRDAGAGLAAAHRAGIAHRDFKPDNVFIDRDAVVKVVDFGLAQLDRAASINPEPADEPFHRDSIESLASDQALTMVGAVVGTPLYMSPEQLAGERADELSDQFSFCIAAWEALYGERPFAPPPSAPGDGASSVISGLASTILRGEIRPAPEGATVPERVRHALVRGLSATRDARWPAMEALLAELAPPSAARRRIGIGVAAVGALAVAAVGVSIALVAHRPATAELEMIGPVRQETAVTLSPNGRWLATRSRDRIEVSDVREPTRPHVRMSWRPTNGQLYFASEDEIDDEFVETADGYARHIGSWNLVSDRVRVRADLARDQRWWGHVIGGDLIEQVGDAPGLVIRDAEHTIRVASLERRISLLSSSPSRQRFAYLGERDSFAGVIHLADGRDGHELGATAPVHDITALAMRDDHTLMYATGQFGPGKLWLVDITPTGMSAPRVIFETQAGSIGALSAGGERLLATIVVPVFLTSLLEPKKTYGPQEQSAEGTSAVLAWRDDAAYWAWNRNTKAIELHETPGALPIALPATLRGDPANATRAGDTLIVAQRGDVGRRIDAIAIGPHGATWPIAEGELLFVRCAGDAAPPCIAGTAPRAGRCAVRWIDPATGTLGATLVETDELYDAALDAHGTKLAWSDVSGHLTERDLATGTERHLDSIWIPRSLVYASDGGLLVAGLHDDHVALWSVHADDVVSVAPLDTTLMTLVRTSTAGSWLSYRRRIWNSQLAELHLKAD